MWMNMTTSQRPTKDDWLADFLKDALEGEVLVSGHWSDAPLPAVLLRLLRSILPYSVSALSVHWWPGEGCYSLLLRTAGLSQSLSMKVMRGADPTPLQERSLRRLLLPYGGRGAFRVVLVDATPREQLKERLRTL